MDAGIRKSVLVVDDNDANILILSALLKRMGFSVDEAKSGKDAIGLASGVKYDLVFMDHLMPGMDGAEAARQILLLSGGKGRPVIIGVSATIEEEVVEAFSGAGVHEILEKPVTMDRLEEKLRSVGVFDTEGVQSAVGQESSISHILSGVRGLDYKKGLAMMAGNIDNYMNVLSACIKNIADNHNAIEKLKGNSRPEDFALHFHSLKGLFLNIGADVLAEKSKHFEIVAKEGRMEEIGAGLEGYLREVLSFHKDLVSAYGQYCEGKKEAAQGKEMSEQEFLQNLKQLRQHIEDFEYMEITEILDKMMSGCRGGRKEILEKIAAYIQEFDYDGALRLVDTMPQL